jgi:hypothetical protein
VFGLLGFIYFGLLCEFWVFFCFSYFFFFCLVSLYILTVYLGAPYAFYIKHFDYLSKKKKKNTCIIVPKRLRRHECSKFHIGYVPPIVTLTSPLDTK